MDLQYDCSIMKNFSGGLPRSVAVRFLQFKGFKIDTKNTNTNLLCKM